MAAVVDYGPDAELSHRSAGPHWGIGSAAWKIHVITPRSRRSRPKTRARQAVPQPEAIVTHDGIPTTSVARTPLEGRPRRLPRPSRYALEARAGLPRPDPPGTPPRAAV